MSSRLMLAAVPAAFLLSLGAAQAEDLVFMLDNQSSYDVVEFYASPVEVRHWEEDILGTQLLPSGDAVRVTIGDGRTVCEYDLRVVFNDGEVLEEGAVDLCETGSYTVTD